MEMRTEIKTEQRIITKLYLSEKEKQALKEGIERVISEDNEYAFLSKEQASIISHLGRILI